MRVFVCVCFCFSVYAYACVYICIRHTRHTFVHSPHKFANFHIDTGDFPETAENRQRPDSYINRNIDWLRRGRESLCAVAARSADR